LSAALLFSLNRFLKFMARKKKVVETIWTRDITHHIVATMAVFGLVMSSLITTLGVATLGVEAQLAFAQNEAASQAAASFLGVDQPAPPPALSNSSSTLPRPVMDQHMGTSSLSMGGMGKPAPFCPTILRTLNRGNNDATTTGDVAKLQMFLANHFNVAASTTVSGYFGSTTQAYLEKFQAEQGIPQAPTAGPLTRAAIAKLCGQGQGDQHGQMGSSTQMMDPNHPPMGSSTPGTMPPHRDGDMNPGNGSTTGQMPPQGSAANGTSTMPTNMPKVPPPPVPSAMPPKPVPSTPVSPQTNADSTLTPVSYSDADASNAASMVDAVSEIGDGYTKLFQSVLSSFGL
jgi:hypothetical protein